MVLEALWRYQWTADSVELSEEWIDLFHDATQGVLDLVVKLFIEAQTDALMRQKPVLRVERVASLAKSRFRLLHPMLDAMRSGNPFKMAKFEDVRMTETMMSVPTEPKAGSERRAQGTGESASNLGETEKVSPDTEVSLTTNTQQHAPDSAIANPSQPPVVAKSSSHRRVVYEQDDIRRLYALLRDGETPPDVLLAQHGLLDEMTMWEDE